MVNEQTYMSIVIWVNGELKIHWVDQFKDKVVGSRYVLAIHKIVESFATKKGRYVNSITVLLTRANTNHIDQQDIFKKFCKLKCKQEPIYIFLCIIQARSSVSGKYTLSLACTDSGHYFLNRKHMLHKMCPDPE
jgi:hypothetical protein